MSKSGYVVDSGVTKKIKKGYVVVNGVTRKIKKAYTVVDGKTKSTFSGSEGKFLLSGRGVNGYSNPGGGYTKSINSFYTKDVDNTSIDISSRIGYPESSNNFGAFFATDGKGRTVMALGNNIYYSDDLITWTHCYDNTGVNPYVTYQYVKLKYLNGNYIALLENFYVSFSSDGVSWSTFEIYDSSNAAMLRDVNFGNGRYVITTGTTTIWSSKNLTTGWMGSYVYALDNYNSIYSLGFNPNDGMFIGYTNQNDYLITSTDGMNWTIKYLEKEEIYSVGFKYVNGKLFYMAGYMFGYATTDSKTYTTINSLTVKDITYGDGVYLILCKDGTLYQVEEEYLMTFAKWIKISLDDVMANEPNTTYADYQFHNIYYIKTN